MVVVLDGGLASTLQQSGHEVDGHPLWSAKLLQTNADAVVEAHAKFVRAGADVVITASYQTSIDNLQQHLGLSVEDALALMKTSVDLARRAAASSGRPDVRVAGSVGPYGACLADGSEYTGKYLQSMSLETLKEWHRPRVAALVSAGADLLAVETLPGPAEARAVLQLLREHPAQRAWVSFSCQDGARTCDGSLFRDAAAVVWAARPDNTVAVGVNCCDPDDAVQLLRSVDRRRAPLPLVVYPNRGETWTGTGWSGSASGRQLASYVADYADAGATYIGGCCRVGPEDISQLRQMVDTW